MRNPIPIAHPETHAALPALFALQLQKHDEYLVFLFRFSFGISSHVSPEKGAGQTVCYFSFCFGVCS